MRELPVGNWGVRGSWHGKVCPSRHEPTIGVVVICCPICGLDSSLSGHTVAMDGVVTPTFYCPYGCGCRITIQLQGYAEFVGRLVDEESKKVDPLFNSQGDSSNYS